MNLFIKTSIIILSFLVLSSSTAYSQQSTQYDTYGYVPGCNKREKTVKILNNQYNEYRAETGRNSQGLMVEVFRTKSGSSWTMITSAPNGMSCYLSSGDGWDIQNKHFEREDEKSGL